MPILFSEFLSIDAIRFQATGAFDPILDADTRLFIDPLSLKHSKTPELAEGYEKLQKRFRQIATLLAEAKVTDDPFWKAADKLMQWPEVGGLCIGYSSKGVDGSGIGRGLRKKLLSTAKQIIDAGRRDPEIFELVGLFTEDIGPDRISDLTANVIREDLVRYSKRILLELDVDFTKIETGKLGLPIFVRLGKTEEIILVPNELLRPLPLALDWSSVATVSIENEAIRSEFNKTIGKSWRDALLIPKVQVLDLVVKHPELLGDLIDKYCKLQPDPYDCVRDEKGLIQWVGLSKRLVKENPMRLVVPNHPTVDEVYTIVLKICERFKRLIEKNGLWKMLYNDKTHKPKSEESLQLLFFGIAAAYCESNKVMIARESNSGRGPVDFKFGTNMENSILVEAKKSTNSSILKGIERQLPAYMGAEQSRRAIYLVVDVDTKKTDVERLNKVAKMIERSAITVFRIDANRQMSASNL